METDPWELAEATPNRGNGRPANNDAALKVDDDRALSALARPWGEGESGEEPPSRTSGEEGLVAEEGPVEKSRPGESDVPTDLFASRATAEMGTKGAPWSPEDASLARIAGPGDRHPILTTTRKMCLDG